jgi:hypothetical protein
MLSAAQRDKLNEDEARHFFRQLVAACDVRRPSLLLYSPV